jgi:hypothetical protein
MSFALLLTFAMSGTVPAEGPLIRLAVVVRGPPALRRVVAQDMERPLAEIADTVPQNEYQRAAKRAGVRKPFSPAAARRVGGELHLTHVLLVRDVVMRSRRGRRTFAEVRLVEVQRPGKTLFAQRYFLPEGRLTASTAGSITERLKTYLAAVDSDVRNVLDTPREAAARRPHLPTPRGTDLDTPARDPQTGEALSRDDADDNDDDDEAPGISAKAPPDEGTAGARRSAFGAGLAVVRRSAALVPSDGARNAPTYDSSGSYGGIIPGLALSAHLFPLDAMPALGLSLDGFVVLASTELPNTSTRQSFRNVVWNLRGAVAFQMDTAVGLGLGLRAGYAYLSFPLSDGAFPGLSYAAPLAGARVTWRLGDGTVTLRAGGEYMFAVQGGLEASRLGTSLGGHAYGAEAGIEIDAGPLEITPLVRYEAYSSRFSGQTFLFTAARFNNVVLDDRQTQLLITVGSRFW